MVRYVKKALGQLFDFGDRERKGAVIIVLLIACTSIFRIWLACHEPRTGEADFNGTELQLRIYQWQEDLAGNPTAKDPAATLPDADQMAAYSMSDFDPNTVTREELTGMGLDPKVAQTLINYRDKGGRFRTPEDLRKIYGMNAGEYNRISPFVRIGESFLQDDLPIQHIGQASPSGETTGDMKLSGPVSATVPFLTELNSADTSALIRLKGIGSVLAARIVKYRQLLGGFARTEQLGEVYGISDSLLINLKDALYADTTLLERIDINHASATELSRHPYIGAYYAEGIVRYREFSGSIHSLEELVANGLLPMDRSQKLKAYLEF